MLIKRWILDDLADAVDYDGLCKEITSFVADSRFDLLEALANTLIKIFQFSLKITAIDLRIHKPGAISNASTRYFCIAILSIVWRLTIICHLGF